MRTYTITKKSREMKPVQRNPIIRNPLAKHLLCLLLLLSGWMPTHAQIKTLYGTSVKAEALDRYLTRQMDSIGIPGVSIAIINNGKIVYHRAIGVANTATKQPLDEQSIFEAASLSKTVFTYFVLKQVDKGLLSLDTPLYQYMEYPDIAYDDNYKLITARMVLSHTTGFPNWRNYDLADSSKHIKPGTLYLKFKPGTQYSYSGEGYYYLSQVIAKLNNCTLQSLDSLFQKEVAVPLGLSQAWFSTNTFIEQHKVNGYRHGKLIKRWPAALPQQDSTRFGAGGGLHTESVNYARFLIALMQGKGLSEKSAGMIFQPQVQLPATGKDNEETAWGLGVAIVPVKNGTVYEHGGNNGNFQSYYRINRKTNSGYVFFTNCNYSTELNDSLIRFFSAGIR